jgi:NADPH:quinone reductase
MKAAFINEVGSPDVIQVGEVAEPAVGPHDVVIRVQAAAVNPIDTYVPHPFIIGCDAAGIVEAIGDSVRRFAIGDRVWCTNQGLLGRQGTFAEKISVNEDWCFALPDQVSFADAAASALVAVTAHLGLYREAMLQAGETLFVIGGSGGVGSMVVQMGKATGASVIATAGTAAKCQRVRELGADVVINYNKESIEEAVKREAPRGVNVFWETRREPDFNLAVELMANRGRMVLMAGRDAQPIFPVGPFYVKECSLHGFVMFKATPVEMHAAATDINHWMAQGKLVANIGTTLTLDQAAEAHRLQEAGTLGGDQNQMGKIVVMIG